MTPLSLPELETQAFRRALAAALDLSGERTPAAWDPLGSVEEDPPVGAHDDADKAAPLRSAA